MKTSYYLRMFTIVATVSAFACSDNDPVPVPIPIPITDSNKVPTGNSGAYESGPAGYLATSVSQYQNQEFHTWVTTWTSAENNTYVGLVAQVPMYCYSTQRISVISNGHTTLVDLFGPWTMPKIDSLQDDYIWATLQSNVMLLHFKGISPQSVPPFPLEVFIPY